MKESHPVLSGFEFSGLLEEHSPGEVDPIFRYDHFRTVAGAVAIGATALLSVAGMKAVDEGRLTGDQLLNAVGRTPAGFEVSKMVQAHHGIDTFMRDPDSGMGIWQSTDPQGMGRHFIDAGQRLTAELAFVRPRIQGLGSTAIILSRFTDRTEQTLLRQVRQLPHPGVYGKISTRPRRALKG